MDIMNRVEQLTYGRVRVGPGTLYNLLEQFNRADFIRETKVEGRRRSYILTDRGRALLQEEYDRVRVLARDYERMMEKEEPKGKMSIISPSTPPSMTTKPSKRS